MSEPKFTRGPWRVDATVALGAYGVWTDYPTHPGHDGRGYESQICSFWSRNEQFFGNETRNANAHLIAAAPDMFAALKAIVNSDMAMREEDEGQESPELDAARAAITQAEGGAK